MEEIAWVGIQDSDMVVMNPLHGSSIYEDSIYANWSYTVSQTLCALQEEWMRYGQSF